MTILEQRFLEAVPSRINELVKELKELNVTVKDFVLTLKEEINTTDEKERHYGNR